MATGLRAVIRCSRLFVITQGHLEHIAKVGGSTVVTNLATCHGAVMVHLF